MSASNRAGAIAKLHSALKKHYSAEPAQPTRPLLEHILYASLLEDCPAELADEGLAKCEQEFFDWNEVRVTTATELAQVLARLPDAMKAATRLKSNLQSIFEQFYTFDLDHLKKENLGKAVAKFEAMPGMTPFVLNYTVQHGLGGHAIPIDYSAMVMMLVTGIASQSEAMAGRVPGLERAVPKNKAIEFSSLLHQAAVALYQDPNDKTARSVLDTVEKGASSRLDDWLSNKEVAKKQRAAQRKADRVAAEDARAEAANEEAADASAKAKPSKKAAQPATKPTPDKPAAKPASVKSAPSKAPAPKAAPAKNGSTKSDKKAATKPVAAKDTAAKDTASKTAGKKAPAAKPSEKPAASKASSAAKLSKKSPPAAKKAAPSGKKPSAKKSAPAKKPTSAKKPSSKKSAAPAKTPPAGKSKKASASTSKSSGSKKSSNRKLTKSKPR